MSEKLYEEAWNYAMKELHDEYKKSGKEDEFTLWFKMKYVDATIDTITVSFPSTFLLTAIQNRGNVEIVKNKIRSITAQSNLNFNCIVEEELVSDSDDTEESSEEEKIQEEENPSNKKNNIDFEEETKSEKPSDKSKKTHPQLKANFTFETFIPGENSNYAYNAAIAVSKEPGKKYNPILLYGGSGLGKTHLMQSIGNYIYNENPKAKICYVSAENFGNDFTSSLTSKKTNEFKNKYRNLDVLLLDDIHFLQGKEGMQNELFYTFEALYQKNAQMVFTCDRPIKEIKNMADRLVSRLSNGLCIDLQPPNYETRIAILQKKLQIAEKTLNQDIIDYVAKNVETNVRDLESALQNILGYADLIGREPTIDNVKNLLRDLLSASYAENISLDVIKKVIADNYQISVSDLTGKKRDKKFVVPRQIAIYIAREITEISFMELGREMGGKDHSTIMHAYNTISDKIKFDPSLESKIQLYIREIKEYKN
ncbi:MAG: chromosomal replication initiator protein DnaA [Treponema sp.]|nr:chromosomal replication initiator protein DnaA [Treponema sp.]